MRSRLRLALGLVLTLAACTRVGAPAPAPAQPGEAPAAVTTSSAMAGVATLAGQRLRITVLVQTDDRGRGTAHLEIPELPLVADGTAAWRGETLELDLSYEGSCPGNMRIRAERGAEGGRLEGTLRAKDCTGEESGTVVLESSRSPSGGAPNAVRVESAGRGV